MGRDVFDDAKGGLVGEWGGRTVGAWKGATT